MLLNKLKNNPELPINAFESELSSLETLTKEIDSETGLNIFQYIVKNNLTQYIPSIDKKFGLDFSYEKSTDGHLTSMMHDASYYRNFDVIESLLKNGAKIDNNVSNHHDTALVYACMNKDKEMIEFLIDKGANIHHNIYNRHYSPIGIMENHTDDLLYELQREGYFLQKYPMNYSPNFYDEEWERWMQLEDAKADEEDFQERRYWNAVETTQDLIKELDCYNYTGDFYKFMPDSPFKDIDFEKLIQTEFTKENYNEILRLGHNINDKVNENGDTLFSLAIKYNQPELANYFLENGANELHSSITEANEAKTYESMREILSMLNQDTSFLNDNRFNFEQKEVLYRSTRHGFNLYGINDPSLSAEQMDEIVSTQISQEKDLINRYDLDVNKYTFNQIRELVDADSKGLDILPYLDHSFSADHMYVAKSMQINHIPGIENITPEMTLDELIKLHKEMQSEVEATLYSTPDNNYIIDMNVIKEITDEVLIATTELEDEIRSNVAKKMVFENIDPELLKEFEKHESELLSNEQIIEEQNEQGLSHS